MMWHSEYAIMESFLKIQTQVRMQALVTIDAVFFLTFVVQANADRMAGLGDWANFVFLGKCFKNVGRLFFWVIFYFFSAKKQKIDYFWAYFYHRPPLVFYVSALGHKYPALDA